VSSMKRRSPHSMAGRSTDGGSGGAISGRKGGGGVGVGRTGATISGLVARARDSAVQRVQVTMKSIQGDKSSNNNNGGGGGNNATDFLGNRGSNNNIHKSLSQGEQAQLPQPSLPQQEQDPEDHSDRFNYALLIVLYTLQGIPMGLSASIPFLLQEKIQRLAAAAAAGTMATEAAAAAAAAGPLLTAGAAAQAAARASYNANAIFALCSWPFSLKLLWAPVVDAIYFKRFGRRKSWLVPVQTLAGLIMMYGANFVEDQLGLNHHHLLSSLAPGSSLASPSTTTMNVRGVTTFFFILYFLMATQDIAVDGWALTMLSKKNRGRGPICNSIGQNIGYFLSFVGFLALNDAESSEKLWRPLFGLPSNPTRGLVSLKGFLRFMGGFMIVTTMVVAIFKRELPPGGSTNGIADTSSGNGGFLALFKDEAVDDDAELDASQIGLRETYHRLWAVCQLPAVRWLFLILVTYRLPTALSDNVKFLKAVEYGLSKSTTALLSPTLILPLGIVVPLVASRIWHMEPLRQFLRAYEWRVTLIPLLDIFMLRLLRSGQPHNTWIFWLAVVASTAGQAVCNSLQFNAQMTFFASRVDPAIGGSYMTLLNTMANLGGTWPASSVMWLLGWLTPRTASPGGSGATAPSSFGGNFDPYTGVQTVFSLLGIAWILALGPKLRQLSVLPDDSWRTHLLDGEAAAGEEAWKALESGEGGDASAKWTNVKNEGKKE
jgi:MFS transporter, PAT family, solute carrier family 33 (acetyl-CoA transportor), member 1